MSISKALRRLPGKALVLGGKVRRRLLMIVYRPLFAKSGRNFVFDPDGTYSFDSIEVGDDVYVGGRAFFSAAISRIRIGSKVMFGPDVMIRGGNHNTSEVGRFMADIKNKRPEDDQDVTIEDDVWVGARVVILKGVTIGRGSIVAAGAVVTRSVPPYAIAGGLPAKVIKWRWDVETILAHEEKLYPPEKRLLVKTLLMIRQEQKNLASQLTTAT